MLSNGRRAAEAAGAVVATRIKCLVRVGGARATSPLADITRPKPSALLQCVRLAASMNLFVTIPHALC